MCKKKNQFLYTNNLNNFLTKCDCDYCEYNIIRECKSKDNKCKISQTIDQLFNLNNLSIPLDGLSHPNFAA